MAISIAELKNRNGTRWANAKLNRNFASVAKSLVATQAKERYQAVEAKTKVPWFIIAVIHEREASQNWNTQLGQGDPLNRVSVHVPKGRGPFSTWENGAYDALVNTSPYAARNTDWSPGSAMTLLEEYNGLGYAGRGIPSPYVWSGTDQYVRGKYVRDGVFDANTVDVQLGCAGLLKTMMVLDPTIKFGSSAAIPTFILPKPAMVTIPSVTTTASSSMNLPATVAVSTGIEHNAAGLWWSNLLSKIWG